MSRHSGRRGSSLRLTASLVGAALGLAACAHGAGAERRAVGVALRGVCGPASASRDSSCAVRGTERVRGGYRVLIDRRPPAGNDRLAVVVRGRGVDVTPVDSTRPAPGGRP
ncbi:hypothetical protein [Gemmatirosa kalamazoonensis]|uniref:hypothetical protein n=1 Tax=Gemmatirosa kalamazoonensis TaxID=861299 RepID=UPI00046C9E51|nr:hypothetical protein [Gemmatirosa kalamazoonensis]